uniref:hypothetical chloroplast RF1 n=1 Tax=Thesium chinense TaxID=210367 RepID=UPI0021ABBC1E|nr:hypothetical chloroplast RF1 [Thesium chinense]QYF09522.1 hypothetical chloroplast RF1 [Thesium chinense]
MNSKDISKFLKFLFDLIITDPNNHKKIINKSIGIKTISKKVPQWSYKLINELEQQEGENEGSIDHQIRSRKAKRIVIFGRQTNTKDINYPDQTDEIALIRYSQQPDFRRDIIKGSMRNQRRKTVIWKLFQSNLNSPLFFDRIKKFSFFSFEISKLIKFIFRNKVSINSKFPISNYNYTDKERKEIKKNKENKREEKVRIEIAEAWDSIILAQIIRGYMLITQSILRKYIILPSLIIVKNIGRMLLFQFPEWSEDLKEWNREVHIKCTYNGVPLSETEFPKNWLMDGIQIKILFPFCLKPWHRSKFRYLHRDPITTKKQKEDFCFLTIWGMETELPFGYPRKVPSFFEPIFKKLEKKIKKLKNKYFIIIRVLNEKIKLFLRISKETKNRVIKNILFIKIIIINLVKLNPIFRLKEVYESSQTKKEKDSIINNNIIYESSIKNRFMDWTKYSLTENKMNELFDRTNKIRNKIEIITKDKKRIFITSKIKTSQSYNTKRGVQSSKNFWKIVKRKNAQLIRKLHYFIKYFIEKIYINIFLCIINITTLNAQLFIESTKNMIDKYIYNNQSNQERIDKRNQTTIRFISTLTKLIYNISNSNKSSQIFYDLSSLSQTYVFYKLLQIQVNNLNKLKLKYVFKYHETSFFVKNKIKDYLGIQGIFYSNSKLKYKKVWKSETKQWKNWLLRSHYQYNLSSIKWDRLVPQKCRNRIKQHYTLKKKNFKKWDLYDNDKDQLIHYKRQTDYEGISLSRKKDNFKKYYRYDLLSYKSINFEYINDSVIYKYPLQLKLQVKKKQNIYYNYNIHKGKLLNILESINNYINNYLVEDGFRCMDKNMNRKYFDYRFIHFCLKKKINIEDSINVNSKINKNIKNKNIIAKINNNKNLVYLKINQKRDISKQTKRFFNWMGMNEEIINHSRYNIGLWFFSEFILLYTEYKIQPWIIPIQLLLFNFNENVKENINRKVKTNLFISSNEKKSFELENKNQEEKDLSGQENLESILSNDFKEYSTKSNTKKLTKKNQYKNNTEEELNFFLKSYLFFQLRWNDLLNAKMINNVKSYCLLLRMINPKEIALVSIQKGEMNLDIMLTPKDLTLTELIKKGILIIEPIRLSVKNDSQFLMYQTVSTSLVHKSKQQQQMNKSYQQRIKRLIIREHKMFENKNYYNLLIPETILSPRCRREFKIRIYFDSKSIKNIDQNPIFNKKKNVKKYDCSLDENKYLDKNKSIKLKLFLWPNYRLEDLTCMSRYWFNTNNGTRLNMLRIHMYPQIKIR